MEKLTNNLATKVAAELQLDNDKKEVIAYGLFAVAHTALSIILVAVFGIIFNVVVEALIISFIGSSFRKYSGGAHASSPGRCAAIGTVVCVGQALLYVNFVASVTTLTLVLISGIGVFSLAFYLTNKLAPVDSPSKPIRSNEKKIRMKKGSILCLCVYILFSFANIAIYIFFKEKGCLIYSLCVYGGILWQVFTLTGVGHNTINKIDAFLNHLTINKGGN